MAIATVQPKTALISVTDKTGIAEFASELSRLGVEIISTGGTAKTLTAAGIEVTPLESFTGFPEMLDGRVKTLHPKVHAGILARRDLTSHQEQMSQHNLRYIDMVVVNLYDFYGAVSSKGSEEEIVEAIDIGGPTLLRAAAKNYNDVLVVVDPVYYTEVIDALKNNSIDTSFRRKLASAVFNHTAKYDSAISEYFNTTSEETVATHPAIETRTVVKTQQLRYGENPHQSAALYSPQGAPQGILSAKQLQGKELSYNNFLDLDSAYALCVDVFHAFKKPTAVFIKHNNPCGVAVSDTVSEAIKVSRACDPLSAFGAVIAVSATVDEEAASILTENFIEVVIAPDFTEGALKVFQKKKNLRILRKADSWAPEPSMPVWRQISGGILRQDSDSRVDILSEVLEAKVVTKRQPTEAEKSALGFAWIVAKHVRSNAIVFSAKDRVLAVGAGQMSRVDAVKLCRLKAEEGLKNSVVASDAFFPLRDGVDVLAESGATAIVQPGGSIKDAEVIAAADEHNVAMIMTGFRHFRH